MKVYKQYQTVALFVWARGLPAFMIVFVILAGINAPANGDAAMLLLFGLPMGGFLLWRSMRMPTRIELHDDGNIVFSAPSRRIEIPASNINLIRPDQFKELGLLVVEHANGEFKMINQFDSFHDFLTELKRLNPSVELRGC
jgi:hypothetical protein